MSFQFEIIILIIWAIVLAETNYRQMFIDSSELCENTFAPKPIRTGGGAIILQLSKPKVQFQPSQKISKSCEIRFKAPSGFGIIAYIEEAYLRQNYTDKTCKDYIQFAQDHSFTTLEKSEKYCGNINGQTDATKGIYYEDPNGNLLIWINVFGRQPTKDWPSIEQVNLTLILTVFHPTCNEEFRTNLDYRSCGGGATTTDDLLRPRPCISAKYFCDGHFNCLNNIDFNCLDNIVCGKIPVDEAYCSGPVKEPVTLDPYSYAPRHRSPNLAEVPNYATEHTSKSPNVTEITSITNNSALPMPLLIPTTSEAQNNSNTIYIYPNSLLRVLWILITVCSVLGLLLLIILVIQFLKVFCYKNQSLSNILNNFSISDH